MPTPALINEATVSFLRHHAPFSGMATADLEFTSERVRLAYFPVGSLLYRDKRADDMWDELYARQNTGILASKASAH